MAFILGLLRKFFRVATLVTHHLTQELQYFAFTNQKKNCKKIRSEYNTYGTNNWLIRALLNSHQEVVGKPTKITQSPIS